MTGHGILIVEDENIVALDMHMRLESMGYQVLDVVDTAAMALRKAAELSPELVLMDIKLKGDQDGIEAAVQLRKTSEVPVIFVTAFTDERTLDRAKRASPYGYIVKPFHERELRIAIELAIYKYQYELSIRRAKDIAEESNRIKSDFLANMSHELKTPLNSVIGFTELAIAESKEREQKEHLSIALSSAKSLLTLIESILDFARMEAGKLVAVSAPFSLDELLDECADSLAIAAFPKGLGASLRRDPAIPDIMVGDCSLLKHILLNLLDNAVKFTEMGRVRLAVSLQEKPEHPGHGPILSFDVSDTGIGIAKEKIPLAFARFSQLDPSKTRKAGGTGLGLAIVAKSVELMGGEISVESKPGKGTRFSVRIPFEPGTNDLERKTGALQAESSTVDVLGFDDECFSDIALALSRLGFSARKIESIQEAASMGSSYLLAEELALGRSDDALEAFPAKRLVVATRLGGGLRSIISGRGVAFASEPLRDSGLRRAFQVLAASSRDADSVGRIFHQVSSPRSGKKELARLAKALERDIEENSLEEAERIAKEAQNVLLEAGDAEGARIAFAGLLAARRGDLKTTRTSIEKIRGIMATRETKIKGEVGNREGL
jgi:signal transduction histidine kinase